MSENIYQDLKNGVKQASLKQGNNQRDSTINDFTPPFPDIVRTMARVMKIIQDSDPSIGNSKSQEHKSH